MKPNMGENLLIEQYRGAMQFGEEYFIEIERRARSYGAFRHSFLLNNVVKHLRFPECHYLLRYCQNSYLQTQRLLRCME